MVNKNLNALLIKNIEDQKEDPLVESILNGNSSFNQEVESFYGLSAKYGSNGWIFKFSDEKNSLSKKGKIPQNLIGVLSPFSKNGLNSELLSHDLVREDYSKFKEGRKGRGYVFLASFLVGGALSYYGLEYNHFLAYMLGTPLAGGSVVMSTRGPSYFPEDSPLDQYINMQNASLKADRLLDSQKII